MKCPHCNNDFASIEDVSAHLLAEQESRVPVPDAVELAIRELCSGKPCGKREAGSEGMSDPIKPVAAFMTGPPDPIDGSVYAQFSYGDQHAKLNGKPSELKALFQSAVKWMERHEAGDYPKNPDRVKGFIYTGASCQTTPSQP